MQRTCLKLAAAASSLDVSMPALVSSTRRCPVLSPSTTTVADASSPAVVTTSHTPTAPTTTDTHRQQSAHHHDQQLQVSYGALELDSRPC